MTQSPGHKGSTMNFLPFVIGVVLAVAAVYSVMIYRFGQYTSEDVASYRAMMAETSREGDQTVTSQHFRQELHKDIYMTRDDGLYQFRLKSKDATLALERVKGETDIVETLEDVSCWLQEDLMYRFASGAVVSSQDSFWASLVPVAVAVGAMPEQRMIYLEANQAVYEYGGEKFVADDARIWRYVVPGHVFTEVVDKKKALLSGVADHVVVTFGAKGLMFKAEGFKAAITLHGSAK